MNRRNFVGAGVSGGALLGAASAQASAAQVSEPGGGGSTDWSVDEIYIERPSDGKPHRGKTLAAIQPHTDDVPIYAAGTVLKLVDEGYKGVLINLSNDEMAGQGDTVGEVILNNRKRHPRGRPPHGARRRRVSRLSQPPDGRRSDP